MTRSTSIRSRLGLVLLLGLVARGAAAQGIVIPYTFVNGTAADADQVNANFAALANNALNRTGGTMTGDLLFTDATYDIGKSGATRPRDQFLSRNLSVGGTATITGAINGQTISAAASLTGTLAVAGASAFTGAVTFAANPVAANSVVFSGKTTGAVSKAIATVDASNHIVFGDASLPAYLNGTTVFANTTVEALSGDFILHNTGVLYGRNTVGTAKTLATIDASNHVVFGDASLSTYLTGALVIVSTLTTTGSATGKKVVCVDTGSGQLYASSTGVDCSN